MAVTSKPRNNVKPNMDGPKERNLSGSQTSGQVMRTQYHDPVSVRRWAASSAAGLDPSLDFPVVSHGDDCMPMVSAAQDAVQSPVLMGFPQGHVQSALGCDQLSSLDFYGSNTVAAPNGTSAIPQRYNGMLELQIDSTGNPVGYYDSPNVFAENGAAFSTPATDEVSLFEPAGAPAMCHQTSSQGYPDYLTEWSSQDSVPGSDVVPFPQGFPPTNSACMSPNANMGSLPSQTHHTHMDNPLPMAMLDDMNWPGPDCQEFGDTEAFMPHGMPDNFRLPHAAQLGDERFAFAKVPQNSSSNIPRSTVRPQNPMTRPRIPNMEYWQHVQTEVPYHMGAPYSLSTSSRRPSDGEPTVTARKHHLYQAQPGTDGLYHCPYEGDDCKHLPEKLKCNYDKHLDSHLKPYRCRNPDCSNQRFSSTACLLRHEREAHGLHGHGEKPFACYFPDCERAQPGQGFPRSWNLRDHMRRVHNYTIPGNSNDYPSPASSPETNLPIRRKKSPEASVGAGVKKSKAGTSTKSSRKDSSSSSHVESKREEYKALKAHIDRTYANLDPMDTRSMECYHADQARLESISKDLRKKSIC